MPSFPGIRALLSLAALAICLATLPVLAQHGIQQKRLNGVSLQPRVVKGNSRDRCLAWVPLRASQTKSRYVEADALGNEGVTVFFSAQFLQAPEACPITFDSPDVHPLGQRTHSSGRIIQDFEIIIQPPAAVVKVSSPGLEEELVFDAPLEADSDEGFFEFFSRSTIYFENRYTVLTTDSPITTVRSVKLFPVFGGKISVPVPFLESWYGGYALFQNLGSFVPNDGVEVAYSEFLFDLSYQKAWRRAGLEFSLTGEVRGRNVYQVSANRPFIVGQVLRPGMSGKMIWFPVFYGDYGQSKLRFGFEASYHYLGFGQIQGNNILQQAWDATLHYRLTSRGALVLGLGYSQFLQSALVTDVSASRINENTKNFYMRLSLFPVRTGAQR